MPTDGQTVKIAHYTRSKFNSLTNKDSATIYYVEESDGKIKQYIGNTHVVSDNTDVVRATTENKNILGTTEEIFNISEKKVWFNKGALFYGTAANAGLVTRGISGVTTDGSAKEHLYINYDGNNNYSRKLILGAGSVGTDRGNGIYDYSAVRGDALITYLTNTLGSYATETYVNTKVATKQNIVVKGTVGTLVGTVAKTATIANYTLTAGDLLYITFTYGNTSSNTTLNINGSGAKNITLGKRNVTGGSGTGSFHLASGAGVLLYYDGVSFVLPGSQDQTDASYSVISDAELTTGTATTGRLVSAKVLRDNFYIKNEIPTAIQTYLLGLPVNP